jgi:hypothetical protein
VTEPTYAPQTWHDLPATDTEINAARLTHVEEGLDVATQRAAVSIRYDVAQALSADAKAQARANLGVGTAAVTVNGVAADGGGDVQLTAADVGASPDLGYAVLEAFGLSPANSAAANDDAIVAALATGKPLRCGPGVFDFAAHHDFGTQGLVGAGGQVARPLTVFRAQNAAAQVELSGGGAACGGFQVDGNLTATTPFKRSGGTGANGRTFFDITVKSNAVSGTHANDLALFHGAQNDLWEQCGFYLADRDGMSFDQGYGGATFLRCEQAGEGRDGLHFDNQVAGGPYPVPSNLEFTGTTIGEYNGVRSKAYINAGYRIVFNGFSFYSPNALTGPTVDVVFGQSISLTNCFIQQTGSTLNTGSQGVVARGISDVSVSGKLTILNIDQQFVVDGALSHIDRNEDTFKLNCSTVENYAQGGGFVTQVNRHQNAPTLWKTAGLSQAIEIMETAAGTGIYAQRNGDGSITYWPGTGFGSSEFTVGRVAAGTWGTLNATAPLRTGGGASGSRPVAALANGMLYYDSTIPALLVSWAGSWHQVTMTS